MRPATDGGVRKAFAKRLQALRIARGYESARAMAQALGVNEMTYGRWERGETEPNYGTLLRICTRFGFSILLYKNLSTLQAQQAFP